MFRLIRAYPFRFLAVVLMLAVVLEIVAIHSIDTHERELIAAREAYEQAYRENVKLKGVLSGV